VQLFLRRYQPDQVRGFGQTVSVRRDAHPGAGAILTRHRRGGQHAGGLRARRCARSARDDTTAPASPTH